jgi:hypothetical protein
MMFSLDDAGRIAGRAISAGGFFGCYGGHAIRCDGPVNPRRPVAGLAPGAALAKVSNTHHHAGN